VKKAPPPKALVEPQGAQTNATNQAGEGRQGDAETSGVEAAAGVLTAVDEDVEGAEEADMPGEFEYFTDNDES
jgi:26S proteasome regulatory subunit N2